MTRKDKSQTTEYNRLYAKKRRARLKAAGYAMIKIPLTPVQQRKINALRGEMSTTGFIVNLIDKYEMRE